jgi:hypothetical protein
MGDDVRWFHSNKITCREQTLGVQEWKQGNGLGATTMGKGRRPGLARSQGKSSLDSVHCLLV